MLRRGRSPLGASPRQSLGRGSVGPSVSSCYFHGERPIRASSTPLLHAHLVRLSSPMHGNPRHVSRPDGRAKPFRVQDTTSLPWRHSRRHPVCDDAGSQLHMLCNSGGDPGTMSTSVGLRGREKTPGAGCRSARCFAHESGAVPFRWWFPGVRFCGPLKVGLQDMIRDLHDDSPGRATRMVTTLRGALRRRIEGFCRRDSSLTRPFIKEEYHA